MFLWLAREHTTTFNREIAVMTGHRNPSTVSRQHRRISRCIEKDPEFSERWLGEAAAIRSRIRG
jgi:chromosomal replication initiation ATPase DnaA